MQSDKKSITILLAAGVLLLALALLYININRNSKVKEPVVAKTETRTSVPKIETLQQGSGDRVVKTGDTVDVNYVGTLQDGTTFDSNVSTEKPFETQIGVGKVIKGWDLGIVGMKAGEKRRLTVSPDLAYGSKANGNIPANSTLIFDIQLLQIK